MSNMSTQSNQQLSRYAFSKVTKCLEQIIRRQIGCKRPLNIKQMSRLQKVRIEEWKCKAVECFEI